MRKRVGKVGQVGRYVGWSRKYGYEIKEKAGQDSLEGKLTGWLRMIGRRSEERVRVVWREGGEQNAAGRMRVFIFHLHSWGANSGD